MVILCRYFEINRVCFIFIAKLQELLLMNAFVVFCCVDRKKHTELICKTKYQQKRVNGMVIVCFNKFIFRFFLWPKINYCNFCYTNSLYHKSIALLLLLFFYLFIRSQDHTCNRVELMCCFHIQIGTCAHV